MRVSEREQLFSTTDADVRKAHAEVDFARDRLLSFKTLAPIGLVSKLKLREQEVKLRTAEAQLSRVEAALNPSTAEIEIAS